MNKLTNDDLPTAWVTRVQSSDIIHVWGEKPNLMAEHEAVECKLTIIEKPTMQVDEDGAKWWMLNGHPHNENGPAVVHEDGAIGWWINGEWLCTKLASGEYVYKD